MTAGVDLDRAIYLYAQALDNSGESICWRSTEYAVYEQLELADSRRRVLLNLMDDLENNGRRWKLKQRDLECLVKPNGDCVIKVKPLSLDASDRVAPVTVVFNVYSKVDNGIARILFDGERMLAREMTPLQRRLISQFAFDMDWPSFIKALHIFLFSKEVRND